MNIFLIGLLIALLILASANIDAALKSIFTAGTPARRPPGWKNRNDPHR